jgi:hypothetical protein
MEYVEWLLRTVLYATVFVLGCAAVIGTFAGVMWIGYSITGTEQGAVSALFAIPIVVVAAALAARDVGW